MSALARYTLLILSLFLAPIAFADDRPNLLVIFTDDQAYRAIGYANNEVSTPNLDALAQDGVIFDRAYIATPICAASRASMMTGVFPQQHESIALERSGFMRNAVESNRFTPIAKVLAAAGYDTAFAGKSHLGDPRAYGFAHGAEHGDISDDAAFAFSEEFIASRDTKAPPFFLWLAPHQPHIPLNPGEEWLSNYADSPISLAPNFRESPLPVSFTNQGLPGETFYRESWAGSADPNAAPAGPPRTAEQTRNFIRRYYATISRLDHQVGELVKTLRRSGHYENTVIFFMSDNGYHLGNHGLGNKITMHEESVRVPFFIRAPSLKTSGARTLSLVSSLDVFPTLCDLAGVDKPGYAMGQSLLPILADPNHALHDYVASECVGVKGKKGEGHRMVRTARWKYMLSGTNEEALFDQNVDPHEMRNVINDARNVEVLSQLRGYMKEWMKIIGDDFERVPFEN